MAIKEYIYLLGVEDVQASLKKLTDQGEQSLAQFRELGGTGAAGQFAPIAEGSKGAADATEQLTYKARDLRGIMYVLRPVLQAAGIEIGQFGSLSRLAGVGLVGLGAAAAGAVVVGLARLEDAARTTRGQLEDLFQSKALGDKAFAGIQAAAQQFHTTISNIAPGIEALKIAWDRFVAETRTFKFVGAAGGGLGQIIPPGMVGSVESLQTAYDNFIKLLRAGRLDQTNATKTAEEFFKAMQNGGKLTADILRTLPVGTINQLAQAMGRGSIDTQQFINEVKLAPINLDKLLEALGRFTQQSDQAFATKAIITYRDKLGEILTTLQDGFKNLNGVTFSNALISFLDGLRDVIQRDIDDIERLINAYNRLKAAFPQRQQIIGTSEFVPLPQPRPGSAPGLPATFKFVPAPEEIKQQVDQIDQEVAPQMEKVGVDWGNALKAPLVETIGQIVNESKPILSQLSNNPIDTAGWQNTANDIKNIFQSLYEQIVQMFSVPIQVQFQQSGLGFGGQPLGAPFAGGGFVRGPGTTTSDSIWAFLSNREYVTRAKAVEYYGLPFMNAINAMRLPKNLFAGHFAGGGLAKASTATAGRPVTLVIDTHKFDMNASADTVKALSRFSVARQLSATGRKPSWVR